MTDYDVIIVGCGPAGMSACLYATRSNLRTLVIEKLAPGGKVISSNNIENWPGIKSISGSDLALEFFKHSFSYGGVYKQGNVLDIIDKGEIKEVVLEDCKYSCYTVIICTGTSERKIGIPGEGKFYGKGVSYCAVCDGILYKDKHMVVVGNSDYALEEALYLSEYTNKIVILNEEDELRASEDLIKKVEISKIVIKNNCKIISINGNDFVTSVSAKNKDGTIENVEADVVFPFIGKSPDTRFTSRLNIINNQNYIEVNEKQETKVNGIYAAGDCTNNLLKQIVTASSSGAVAAISAYKYIKTLKKASL